MLLLPPSKAMNPAHSGEPMAANYSMTAELLAAHGIRPSVAEIHGVLSGQICTGDTSPDLELCFDILDIQSDVDEVITNFLKMLAEDINTQLKSPDYAFHSLLPDDEEPLTTRLVALSSWCDSFNIGFAGAWVKDDAAMAQETREVLQDFSRIALVNRVDEDLDEKENEMNYIEVVEYARMAAITVYTQNIYFTPEADLDEDLPTEHDIH
jgi:uncharacterized protein YgfB (UPF0149 family)